ncbi:hypothetical protein LINGRAHAP2_LOCUS31535 [Linum grandiflorum]
MQESPGFGRVIEILHSFIIQ